jgi:hypothetical protein
MMRHELQDRIGPVEDDQWQALERIYAYHPDIPDVGAEDAFASMFLTGSYNEGANRVLAQNTMPDFLTRMSADSRQQYRHYLITMNMLRRANEEAAKSGAAPVLAYTSCEWWGEYDVNDQGFCVNYRPKSVKAITSWLSIELGDMVDEYLSCMEDGEWPISSRIGAFPVTGGSEGHYIHVEALANGKHTTLILGKTFQGMDHAWAIARRIGDLLGV